MIGSKKAVIALAGLRSPSEKTRNVILLKELREAGKIKPVIDRHYPPQQTSEANRHVEQGQKRVSTAITVTQDHESEKNRRD